MTTNPENVCVNCGREIDYGWDYCTECLDDLNHGQVLEGNIDERIPTAYPPRAPLTILGLAADIAWGVWPDPVVKHRGVDISYLDNETVALIRQVGPPKPCPKCRNPWMCEHKLGAYIVHLVKRGDYQKEEYV